MKDSNTHEAMISLEIDLKPEDVAVQMEALLSYIYDSKSFPDRSDNFSFFNFVGLSWSLFMNTQFVNESFLFREEFDVVLIRYLRSGTNDCNELFGEQIFLRVTENYIKSYPVMDYIRPALKYDNQLALMSSTKALVEVILSVDVST